MTDKDDSMANVTAKDASDSGEVESPLTERETSEIADETNQDKKRRRVAEEDNNENVSGAGAATTPKLPTKFELIHKKGDLFTCSETNSLAHCVSRDLGMGKGIAVLFKRKFGGVEELKRQGKGVGDVALLKRGHRFVYYLITKEKYSGKPTYGTLKSSLIAMKRHMLENDVGKISMPRIGCGLDLLEWSKVEMMLRDIFQDTDIVITIYTL